MNVCVRQVASGLDVSVWDVDLFLSGLVKNLDVKKVFTINRKPAL